nr:amino acid adenylation domain-containing protein [Microbulbifer sediminum]
MASEDLQNLVAPLGEQPILWLSEQVAEACWLLRPGDSSADSIARLDSYVTAFALRRQENEPFLHESLDIVSADERRTQARFGRPYCESSHGVLLFEAVAGHAQSRPDHTALVDRYGTTSYSQLDNLANAAAALLAESGVRREDYVGLYIERSHLTVACLLGIQKLGAVYVPLDTEFPTSRLEAVCKQLEFRCIISSHESRAKVSALVQQVILTEQISTLAESDTLPAPDTVVDLDDCSHVFFTSGTTGAPKGILATHRNLDHSLSAALDRYEFTDSDRFVSMARSTFSISMFEMLTALRVGGSVAILAREDFLDSDLLLRAISGASVIHAVPSLLARIMDCLETSARRAVITSAVRTIISGGDTVPPELLERAKKIFPLARIFVCYGSSETSCMGCTYEVPQDRTIGRTKIGRPHANTHLQILDGYGNPVPLGAPGELYFSGPGVVRGYIDRPGENREKFREIDGRRYFATGDIGRFDQEGYVELLGRNDFQVQIDGNRVELQEIELQLKACDSIRQAVVSGWVPGNGQATQLVAYLVMTGDTALSRPALTAMLADHLPAYMIPAHFVVLTHLPTNFNGKVDRNRLPPPSRQNSLPTGTVAALPGSSTEERLYRIWCTYFPELDFSIHDSFFDLGGNSLKAVRMLTEVARTYGFAPPLRTLLTAPSISELAKAIDSGPITDDRRVVTAITNNPSASKTLYCCNGILQYRDLATALGNEWQVCGVALPEEASIITAGVADDWDSDITNFGQIVERYAAEIAAYQPHGPYYLCGASFGGLVAAEVARVFRSRGEEVAITALFDSWYPRQVDSSMARAGAVKKLKYYIRKYVLRRLHTAGNDPREQARRRALDHFRHEYLDLDILLFKARDREQIYGYRADPYIGWAGRARSVSLFDVPGNHIGILLSGNVERIAEVIREKARDYADTRKSAGRARRNQPPSARASTS